MNHDDMLETLEAVQSAELADLSAILVEHAGRFELAGTPDSARLLHGGGEDHILLAVAFDAGSVISFKMIPVALVDDQLRAALDLINRRVFAGAGDLREEQWDAAVLVMAASAAEMPTAEQHYEWAADEGSKITLEEIEAVWKRWAGTGIASWSDLERRVTALYTYRRAM